MLQVRYFDECKWVDAGEGMSFAFTHEDGSILAEAALVDFEAKLWKYEVTLPEKFQWEEKNPVGLVYTAPAAKRVAETILLNTILVRS